MCSIAFRCSQRGPDVASNYIRNSMIKTKVPDFALTMSRTIKCNHCSIFNQQRLFYTVNKNIKLYCIYRCFNTQNYIYPFQNLSLGFIVKIFLKFCKFQPRYSYKIYSYPLNTRVQQILLDNFKVIADDPATSLIFPRPPIIAFRRDDNLRISLVHTTEKQVATRTGTYPCHHPRCRTCGHISSETDLLGPKDRLTIKDSFSCLSSGLIYCIFCRRCPAIYIGETGRTREGTFW